jgi:hypothetical protein
MGIPMDQETLERVSTELMRQGQLMEAAWMGARMMLLPRKATEAQLRLMRTVFFCGAKCFFTALQHGDFRDRLSMLAVELDQFDAFMRQRKPAGKPQ